MASSLRQETVIIGDCSQWDDGTEGSTADRTVVAGTHLPFPVGLAGGSIMCPHFAAAEDQGILWQIDNSSAATLRLTDFKLSQCQLHRPVVIPVHCQLFPAVVLLQGSNPDPSVSVVALLADGSLMLVTLFPTAAVTSSHPPQQQQQQQQPCPHEAQSISISSLLSPHGTPTSLGATPEHLCIGCSSGVVLCIPVAALLSAASSNSLSLPASAQAFELRNSGWGSSITGLIASAWQGTGARPAAALACMPVTSSPAASPTNGSRLTSGGRSSELLVVAYDDCSVACWSVTKRQQLFADTLLNYAVPSPRPGSAVSSFCPSHVSATSPAPDMLVVVAQLNALDSAARVVTCTTYAVNSSGRLQQQPGGSSSGPLRVTLDVDPKAAVLGSAAGREGEVWLLLGLNGRNGVAGYSHSTGRMCCSILLHEAGGMPGGAGDGLQEPDMTVQEMWLGVLHCSGMSEEAAAATHILPLLLAPGCGSRAALRHTLALFEEPLSIQEAVGATHAQLAARIQAAVSRIQRIQQQRVPRPRGGMLSVLRPASMAESLAAAGQLSALAGLPEPMQVVHSCVQMVSSTLGPWALESALQLVIAGVDLGDKLLPCLSTLLMSGPKGPATAPGSGIAGTGSGSVPVSMTNGGSSGGGGSRAAWAVSDQGRQAQVTWRRARQQLLLALGRRLGVTSDPLQHIRDYCRLMTSPSSGSTQLAGTGVASSAATPAAGSPAAVLNLYAHTAAQCHRHQSDTQRQRCRTPLSTTPSTVGHAAAVVQNAVVDDSVLLHPQVSAAQCSSTLELLVMLALLHQLQGAGAAPLTQAALAEIEQALMPTLTEQLRRAAVALWLATTASSQGSQLDADALALQALSHMRLGGSRPLGGGSAAGLQPPQQPPQQRPGSLSLAATLLPDFLKGRGSAAGRDLPAGFASYLMHGADPCASFQDRVLQLGFHLFSRQDFSALQGLTRMLGSSTGMQDAGSCFLQGLATACKLRQRQAADSRQLGMVSGPTSAGAGSSVTLEPELVGEAVRCFFQAAAGLSDASNAALRDCIQQLHRQLTDGSSSSSSGNTAAAPILAPSTPGPPGPQQQQPPISAALQQLRYCECVMMLFERDGAPAGAAAFAAAALQHLPGAYAAAAGGSGGAAGGGAVAEQQRHEGRLWSNLFAFNVELGRYGEAYVAATSNPLPPQALDCLTRLVNVLCEERQVSTLMSLPLVGSVPGSPYTDSQGAPALSCSTPLLQHVMTTLRNRAHNLELGTSPQPYQVLHDFLLSRWDTKGAAAALLAFARRLRLQGRVGDATAVTALRAYDGAANLLASLDPKDAWLDLTDAWIRTYRIVDPDHQPGTAAAAAAATPVHAQARTAHQADYPTHPQAGPSPQQQQDQGGAGAVLPSASSAVLDVALTLPQLRKERWMLQAALLVSRRVPGLHFLAPTHTTATLFRQLLTLQHFDEALALAHATHHTPGSPGLLSAQQALIASLASAAAITQLASTQPATTSPLSLFTTIPAPPPPPTTTTTAPGAPPPGRQHTLPAAATGSAPAAGPRPTVAGSGIRSRPAPARGPACYGSSAAPLWNKLRAMLAAAQPPPPPAPGRQHPAAGSSGLGGSRGGSHAAAAAAAAGLDAGAAAHSGGGRGFAELRAAAADAILLVDQGMELPQWLLDLFLVSRRMGRHAPTHTHTALSHRSLTPLSPLSRTHRSLTPLSPLSHTASNGPRSRSCVPATERGRDVAESCPALGMGASFGGPAALLDLYLARGRPLLASTLVCHVLRARATADVRQRQAAASCWFPYRSLETLRSQLLDMAGTAVAAAAANGGASGSASSGRELALGGLVPTSRGGGVYGGGRQGGGAGTVAREALSELDLAIDAHLQMAMADTAAVTRHVTRAAGAGSNSGSRSGGSSLMIMA
ncbi:MAG: hypothetical protein WDW38_001846 [Sanguina aurantia]